MQGNMFTDGAPSQIGGVNRDNIEYYSTYNFNLSWSAQSFPKINLDLHYGCDELRWDVSGLARLHGPRASVQSLSSSAGFREGLE